MCVVCMNFVIFTILCDVCFAHNPYIDWSLLCTNTRCLEKIQTCQPEGLMKYTYRTCRLSKCVWFILHNFVINSHINARTFYYFQRKATMYCLHFRQLPLFIRVWYNEYCYLSRWRTVVAIGKVYSFIQQLIVNQWNNHFDNRVETMRFILRVCV